jgi:hypothetical protein
LATGARIEIKSDFAINATSDEFHFGAIRNNKNNSNKIRSI